MTEPKRDPWEVNPIWALLALAAGVASISLAAAGWALGWSWSDEFWRSVLVEVGVGVLLAVGGYVGIRLLRHEAEQQRVETITAVREEVHRLQQAPPAPIGSSDVAAPELHRFEIAPASVDISGGPGVITLTAELSDQPAGMAGDGYTGSPTQVRFQSPSGQILDGLFQPPQNLVSGDRFAGVYEDRIRVQRHSEAGTWVVQYFLLVDQLGNHRSITASEMKDLGFPTSFEVIS